MVQEVTRDATASPLVSCLLVTADRPQFLRRAIQCFRNQTYPNKELVVVDDGEADLSPILADLPGEQVQYCKRRREGHALGRLRNVSLDAARGEILAQWDDDDWYHPTRLERQVEELLKGYDACVLSSALMHIDTESFIHSPFVGTLKHGVPGTIVHRRDDAIRYPEIRRGEDTEYLARWRSRRFVMLPRSDAYLFIRCFHGQNTWELSHFMRRIRNSGPDFFAYVWHRYVRGDVKRHPRFQIDEDASIAFSQYLEESYALGLLDPELKA